MAGRSLRNTSPPFGFAALVNTSAHPLGIIGIGPAPEVATVTTPEAVKPVFEPRYLMSHDLASVHDRF